MHRAACRKNLIHETASRRDPETVEKKRTRETYAKRALGLVHAIRAATGEPGSEEKRANNIITFDGSTETIRTSQIARSRAAAIEYSAAPELQDDSLKIRSRRSRGYAISFPARRECKVSSNCLKFLSLTLPPCTRRRLRSDNFDTY